MVVRCGVLSALPRRVGPRSGGISLAVHLYQIPCVTLIHAIGCVATFANSVQALDEWESVQRAISCGSKFERHVQIVLV